jgi:hypothetical protein
MQPAIPSEEGQNKIATRWSSLYAGALPLCLW